VPPEAPRFFRVVGLEQRQHYKNRNPPWIKLHMDRLEDVAFADLPDNTKGHLLLIELLAARTGNRLPLDERFISGRINARSRVNLTLLTEQGFLEILASAPLADRKQVATALSSVSLSPSASGSPSHSRSGMGMEDDVDSGREENERRAETNARALKADLCDACHKASATEAEGFWKWCTECAAHRRRRPA
jgi:hypothetical protein